MNIAPDSTGQASQLSPSSPWTFLFDNVAGNYVRVSILDYLGNFVTGVTYNGVAMTQVVAAQEAGGNLSTVRTFELLNAATGSHTVSVVFTGSPVLLAAVCVSYTSADIAYTASHNEVSAASITDSVTANTANSWVYMAVVCDSVGNPTAGTGAYLRQADTTYGALSVFDSNGDVTGLHSMTVNSSGGGQRLIDVMDAFAPAASGPTAWPWGYYAQQRAT